MSASYVVDLGNTTISQTSITTPALSGIAGVLSGALVGNPVDMRDANSFTNLHLAGVAASGNAVIRCLVQTSDATTSGSFTDPTSGLAQMPTSFSSGGVLWLNSGADGGTFGAVLSGQNMMSGFDVFAGFQRPHRYVRALLPASGNLSGNFGGTIVAGFVAQAKVTGSGGGFTYAPTSGTVNV